jgi:hypothetical protein
MFHRTHATYFTNPFSEPVSHVLIIIQQDCQTAHVLCFKSCINFMNWRKNSVHLTLILRSNITIRRHHKLYCNNSSYCTCFTYVDTRWTCSTCLSNRISTVSLHLSTGSPPQMRTHCQVSYICKTTELLRRKGGITILSTCSMHRQADDAMRKMVTSVYRRF